jgi:hypothetical protein
MPEAVIDKVGQDHLRISVSVRGPTFSSTCAGCRAAPDSAPAIRSAIPDMISGVVDASAGPQSRSVRRWGQLPCSHPRTTSSRQVER